MGFGNMLGSAASSLYNNMPSFRSVAGTAAGYAAPKIGSALGSYFGGASGAGMGNTLGNMLGGYLSGGPSPDTVKQGMGYLNQFGQGVTDQTRNQMQSGLGRYLSPEMQNTAMNTRMQDMGSTLGQQYGQQLGQQYAPSWAAPAASWLGGKIGSGIGSAGQSIANRFIPSYLSQSSPNQMAGMAGNQAKNAVFNQLPQNMQNLTHFQEMPFAEGGSYARGGYAMGGGIQNSAPMNISNPYMNYGGGQSQYMGSMNPVTSYAMGGYAGADQSYGQNNEYGLNSLNEYGLGAQRYRPSLREYSDMMPMS